jgi:4-hydroxy-tetrahydrodipicolinate synthase
MTPLLCRNVTTFTPDGAIDEDAFARSVDRLAASGHGVYVGSGGSGEGHALRGDELHRLYRIAVEVCAGRVPANANPPERHTAGDTIAETLRAAEAGVGVVNVYGPTALHGYRPTPDELVGFFDEVLGAVHHSVALAPNPVMGYLPPARMIAALAGRHRQVVAINLSGLDDAYFVQLLDALERDVEIYVPLEGAPNLLPLGATGIVAAEPNLMPKTCRAYLRSYESGARLEMACCYAEIRRMTTYVAPWQSATPRWLKMAMRHLKLPGGEGGVRGPYRLPPENEQHRFMAGLLRLNIPEVTAMALQAGLEVPA